MNLRAAIVSLMLTAAMQPASAASDLTGRVLFPGLAVPGAIVTACQGDRSVSTISDDDGAFRLRHSMTARGASGGDARLRQRQP